MADKPTSLKVTRAVLLAGASVLASAPAGAQTAAPPAATTVAGTEVQGISTSALRGISDDPAALAPAAQRPRARPARRTRAPTRAVVQIPTRAVVVPTAVSATVQQPVTGLPDPVAPVAPRRRPPNLEDPYGQLGIRSGGLLFLPWLEQSVGYDTNPNRSFLPQGSTLLRTEGGLRLRSDWLAHELTGELRGAYSVYPDLPAADRPEGAGRLNLRIDASRDTALTLETRFLIDTQRPGSPELSAPVRDRPLIATYGAAAGVTQRFNRLEVMLRGTLDQTAYEDARLPDGTILSQRDREYTQYGAQLRFSYELTPGVKPFIEGLVDTRAYHQRVDFAGFRRSSDAVGARLGTTFELTRLLTGELAAGYQSRRYDDPRLRDLSGPLLEGALVWSATPLTTVRLRAQTTLDESTIPNASGALTRRATLEVQHDLRRNLSLIGALTGGTTDYRGISLREEFYSASLKLDYRLTRWLAFRASVTHERVDSSSPLSDYRATTYLVGLRLQP